MGPPHPRRRKTPPETNEQTARLGDVVGARAARVAHELRVPVSVISGSLENLEHYVGALVRYVRAVQAHLPADSVLATLYDELGLAYVTDNAPALLKLCRDGSQQLNHLVEQIRGFARPAALPHLAHAVDVVTALADALAMVTASREKGPTVNWTMDEALAVRGAPESLGQAFVNILGNAFDAVADVPDGQVWISGCRLAEAGQWVEVRVSDNGPGVPPALRQRIFDPFFTTKSHGGGLGLGLAITREIIQAHGGDVEVADTQPGATFRIKLPAAVAV